MSENSPSLIEAFKPDEEKILSPFPEKAIIDYEKANKWIEAETDERFRKIKQKLVDNVNYVDFATFRSGLDSSITKFNELISESDDPYAVLWDYKPHSSKKWTYGLIESTLIRKPDVASYFSQGAENKILVVDKLLDKDITKIAIIDDAAYSGEQILNKSLIPIVKKFKEKYPEKIPEFFIVIPFVTEVFKEKIEEFRKINPDCKVNLIYSKTIPIIEDILSDEDFEIMKERNGSIEIDSDEPIIKKNTITFFDHRVADDHSLAPEIGKILNIKYEKPYGDAKTKYSEKEKRDFERYWEPFLDSVRIG